MDTKNLLLPVHPEGEFQLAETTALAVDTFGGRVHVEWDPQAAVTPMGQLTFFIDFLKTAELFDPWVEDCPLRFYGHQEGAKIGYNPQKPGRPSHVYHTYFIANLRLVLDVEVQAGNRSAASYTSPGLFTFIDSLPSITS